jgi:hypothetical protein
METKYIFLDVDGTLINEENIRLVIKNLSGCFSISLRLPKHPFHHRLW